MPARWRHQLLGSGGGGGTTIPLTAARLASGSGTTLISSGVPLQRGQLAPANVGAARLLRNGVEVACYMEALGVDAIDGSALALLVQYQTPTSLASGATDSATYVLELTGATVARTSKTPITGYTPAGIWTPTSATQRCHAGVWPVPVTADYGATPSWRPNLPVDIGTWGDYLWNTFGPIDVNNGGYGGASYDSPLAWWAEWARTGTVEWFRRACQQFGAWSAWLTGEGNYTGEWYYQTWANFSHYLLTGYEAGKTTLRSWAQGRLNAGFTPDLATQNTYMDGRVYARHIGSCLALHLLNETTAPTGTNAAGRSWLQLARAYIDGLWACQQGSGWFAFAVQETLAFMIAMCLNEVAIYNERVAYSTADRDKAKLAADWMIANRYYPAYNAYAYDQGGSPYASPDVSGFHPTYLYWLAYRLGNATYRTQGDAVAEMLTREPKSGTPGEGPYVYTHKVYGEAFSTLAQGWRFRELSGG